MAGRTYQKIQSGIRSLSRLTIVGCLCISVIPMAWGQTDAVKPTSGVAVRSPAEPKSAQPEVAVASTIENAVYLKAESRPQLLQIVLGHKKSIVLDRRNERVAGFDPDIIEVTAINPKTIRDKLSLRR